ncbi:MAG TPA: hypothetical protein VJ728_17615 [Candidatus Binataceae bacterium]|nr:hypothetical protein [Candidatus Binataceae bacterium]
MDAGEWEAEFTEARRRLLESNDFRSLISRGHDLKNSVVLTSVSNVPFEVSFKCIYCDVAFWFENAAWSTGGEAEWYISSISKLDAITTCRAIAVAIQHGP